MRAGAVGVNLAAVIFIVAGLAYGAWAASLAQEFGSRALLVLCVAGALVYLGRSLLQRRPQARRSAFATAVVVALSNAAITGMLAVGQHASGGAPVPAVVRPGWLMQAAVAVAFSVAAAALLLERRGEGVDGAGDRGRG